MALILTKESAPDGLVVRCIRSEANEIRDAARILAGLGQGAFACRIGLRTDVEEQRTPQS